MFNWHLEVQAIKNLKPHPKNPRKLTKEQYKQLKKSMDKFGLIDKPIINKDKTIIGGHQRIEVLKKDKAKNVECWVCDDLLDEKQIEELMIRLNHNHGQFDYDMLANTFDIGDLIEWGFTDKDFDLNEIEDVEEEEETKKQTKECPNCGHQF